MKHSKKVHKTETVIGSSMCSIIVVLACFNGVTRTRVTTVEEQKQEQEVATVDEDFCIDKYKNLQLSYDEPNSNETFSPIMFGLEGDYKSFEDLQLNKELKEIAGIKNPKNSLVFLFSENETGIEKDVEIHSNDIDTGKDIPDKKSEAEEETEESESFEETDDLVESEEATEDTDKIEESETEKIEEVDDSVYEKESEVQVAVVDYEEEEVVDEAEIDNNTSDSENPEAGEDEDPDSSYKENYDREVQLLAGIMYLEEGIYVDNSDGEYIHKLAGSVVLHRVESDIYPDSVEGVLYDPGQYGSRTKRLIDTVEIPEKVYVWAEELMEEGPIGPSNLVFQAGIVQGEVYYSYGNQYFCLSKYVS